MDSIWRPLHFEMLSTEAHGPKVAAGKAVLRDRSPRRAASWQRGRHTLEGWRWTRDLATWRGSVLQMRSGSKSFWDTSKLFLNNTNISTGKCNVLFVTVERFDISFFPIPQNVLFSFVHFTKFYLFSNIQHITLTLWWFKQFLVVLTGLKDTQPHSNNPKEIGVEYGFGVATFMRKSE